MSVNVVDRNTCFGCKACSDVCAFEAIEFVADLEGFWHPSVDRTLCVECGLCEKACPALEADTHGVYKLYGGWHSSSNKRDLCSSGAVGDGLVEFFIREGGLVVGAVFGRDLSVSHASSDDVEANEFRRSKYVQSDTGGIFQNVKDALDANRRVLFFGTPCQVAALCRYIEVRGCCQELLWTCDLSCFGVPSPKVYRAYLEWLRDSFGSDIASINFKDKRYGWDYYTTSVRFKNGKRHCVFGGDAYKTFMQQGYSLRLSCFNCPFNEFSSSADITLGDFYGVEHFIDKKIPKNGVSKIVVHSERGDNLIHCLDGFVLYEVDALECKKQTEVVLRRGMPQNRKEFFDRLNATGFAATLDMIPEASIPSRLKKRINALRHLIG